MSSKLKTRLSLLAVTAAFAIGPGALTFNADNTTQLFAQEASSDRDANGLGILLDSPASATKHLSAGPINDALSLQAGVDATNIQTTTQTTQTTQKAARADENPFLPVQEEANLNIKDVQSSEPFSMGIMGTGSDVGATAATTGDAAAGEARNAAETEKAKVDETALQYYARTKDLKRLSADMRRLQQLYPDWRAPKDLFSEGPKIDEQPFWDLYKMGDYAAIRARIAQMQSSNPKWIPSDELLLKLQLGEARDMVYRAYDRGSWDEVISAAQSTEKLLVCDEMQVLWDVGEAFARVENYNRSFELYRYILDNCTDPKLRLSTVQKASSVLPPQGTIGLIALGKTTVDGGREFDDIAFNSTRRQLGEFIENGLFSETPANAEMERFVSFIKRKRSMQDANLVGWYFYSQREWAMAQTWFLQAARFERNPKSIEGVILTLRNLDETNDALAVSKRFAGLSPEIKTQYIEILSSSLTSKDSKHKVDADELAVMEEFVMENKSPLGAQALGWKYLADGERQTAAKWFTTSVEWKPTEGGVVGLAVLASREKNYARLADLKRQYEDEYKQLSEMKVYKKYKKRKRV
jgi:hypothetical protein